MTTMTMMAGATAAAASAIRKAGMAGARLGHWPAALLFLLILAWRFYQVRALALPAWVDSVHHALLVRFLLEEGSLLDGWRAYLPQVPFYYHVGFHLSAAGVARLFGLNPAQAVLATGQLWQALLALSVYSLALTVWGRRDKALTAMLLVGFVSQMPAYYATWGRYTLLAGLTLLSLAMAAALARRYLLLALLLAATAVTHYYAFFLLLLFLGILMLALAFSQPAGGRLGGGLRQPKLLATVLVGGLLAAPWLGQVFIAAYERGLFQVRVGAGDVDYAPAYIWYLLGPLRSYVLLALALAAGGASLWRQRRGEQRPPPAALALTGWLAAMIALLGPWQLGPFRPDQHAAIVLFLPVVVLAAEGLWLLRRPALIGLATGLLVVWGGWQTGQIINPQTIIATADDLTALAWAADHTPADARFLIDVVPWGTGWRGADGGWWLTPWAGRQTVLPVAIHGWGSLDAIARVNALAARIYALRQAPETDYCQTLTGLMQRAGASHYYTRQSRPARCPALQPLYQGPDGITIYRRVLSDE